MLPASWPHASPRTVKLEALRHAHSLPGDLPCNHGSHAGISLTAGPASRPPIAGPEAF